MVGLASPALAAGPPQATCTDHDGNVTTKNCFSALVSPAKGILTPDDLSGGKKTVFTVWDNGDTSYTMEIFAVEFTQDRGGQMVLADRNTAGDSAGWVTIEPSTISLDPGKSAEVSVSVDAPESAPAGDHNISIVFRKEATETPGALNVARQIGAQLLVQVPGPVVHDVRFAPVGGDPVPTGQVVNAGFLGLYQSGSTSDFTVDVVNKGTVHESYEQPNLVTGTIEGFGAPDGATLSMPAFTVLRESTREMTATWNDDAVQSGAASAAPPAICFCSATFTLPDGNGGSTTFVSSFVLFPIWQTIVGLLALVLIIWLWIHRRRKARKLRAELSDLRAKVSETSAPDDVLKEETLIPSQGVRSMDDAPMDKV